MLAGDDNRGYHAACDRCGATSAVIPGSHSLAVLRLMQAGWTMKKTGETICPACATSPPPSR